MSLIHSTAVVSPQAQLGVDVSIGAFSIVHSNVVIGDGTSIGSHCELGHPSPTPTSTPLLVGYKSTIRSHSVLYEGSTIGHDFACGHHVTIREGSVIGEGASVGTLSDIEGDCQIGRLTRLHSNVHVGKGSIIGDFVWLYPYAILTNDPQPPSEIRQGVIIGDFAVVASHAVLLPGVKIGEDSLVGANSTVSKDVPSGRVFVGSPAKDVGPIELIPYRGDPTKTAYPWRFRYQQGHRAEEVRNWVSE